MAERLMVGVRGRLIAASFAEHVLPGCADFRAPPHSFVSAVEKWSERCEGMLGPASSVRAIADVAVVPLLRLLGLEAIARSDGPRHCRIATAFAGQAGPIVVVTAWGEPLAHAWRTGVIDSIAANTAWCLCCNGTALRFVDARRTWSREFVEFDLFAVSADPGSLALLWTIGRGEAIAATAPVIERLAGLSAAHGSAVCKALGGGVLEALSLLIEAVPSRQGARLGPPLVFEQCLTVLYRVLFLLFAEARGLLPLWHPVYRDRYSLDAIVTNLLAGRPGRGLWPAINAISRLAHAGCDAGELKVTAFNGRLFSPQQAAGLANLRVGDAVMTRVVAAVSTTAVGTGPRRRIGYRDLDVEQLGAVYERVLDYQPSAAAVTTALQHSRDARKASGTFYTPRAVTAFLVRQTLEPLVRGRSADAILALKVVDPAMGSGAFLVAACRYLARAAEEALIRDGRWHPGQVAAASRTQLRRDIAARCLYGVDLNPMAVQLGRLSLWLATLAADKPLSFLDHRLVAGDSLIGAAPADLLRQPGGSRRSRRAETLPLFDHEQLTATFGGAVGVRARLAAERDESAAVVRAKERALAALRASGTSIDRLAHVLDLWCAGWFWPAGAVPDPATARELADHILRDRSVLPARVAQPLLDAAHQAAAKHRFLHWQLTFPEVFADGSGRPLPDGGFDAVIGNPPWDMLRGDSGEQEVRLDRQRHAREATGFFRESGIYSVETRAHVNRYQLFLERALQLVRRGGRIGFVLPSGVVSDAGAAALRRHLFARAAVDAVTGLDNRQAIFPIHRSVRFVLLTCTSGQPTTSIRCRFGVSRPEELDDQDATRAAGVTLTRALLARLSGDDDLGLPELATATDLRIVERISATTPWLSAEAGWHAQFGRELNATDDRAAFEPIAANAAARPVIEGKLIEPFRVNVDGARLQLRADTSRQTRIPRRPRLAYRDVASATNRLTLIAAIVPARAVTTHTLFCLKTPLPLANQQVLCGLLNSFVANYLIRMRVNTHVTVALVSRLPVPLVHPDTALHARLAALSAALTDSPNRAEESDAYVGLQALVARLYRLSAADFEHVLNTFPLIDINVRSAALRAFNNLR